MDNSTRHPFVTLARKINSEPPFQPLLSRLQNYYDVNNNVMLFLVWYAVIRHGRIRKRDFSKLENAVALWHERVVLPFERIMQQLVRSPQMKASQVRHWLTPEYRATQHLEQLMLVSAYDQSQLSGRNTQQSIGDACHNLLQYLVYKKVQLTKKEQSHLLHLLQLCFPETLRAEVHIRFKNALVHAQLDKPNHTQLSLTLG